MIGRALWALVRKDLQIYLADRRAALLVIALPIAFASFFGALFGGHKGDATPTGIAVLWVDEDQSALSRTARARLEREGLVTLTDATAEPARASVASGKVRVAVHIAAGFAAAARDSIAVDGAKPSVELWYDPSNATELQLIRGRLTAQLVPVVEQSFFAGDDRLKQTNVLVERTEQRPELPSEERDAVRALRLQVARYGAAQGGTAPDDGASALPIQFVATPVVGNEEAEYNGYSHAFAGSGVQFVLFGAIESGVAILTERQRGIWRRLRIAPIRRPLLLLGRAISGSLFCLFALLALYAFGWLVFGVRVEGSVAGFALVCVAYAISASTFGLALATLGRTPAAARVPAIVIVLMMGMLGGTMVPSFLFPRWMQTLSYATPTRWALVGLEAVTWRGQGVGAVLWPSVVLVGFSLVAAAVTALRFPWDSEA